MKKTNLLVGLIITLITVLVFSSSFGQCPTLVWSDEFDGTELDLTKWEPQIGDGCDYGICGWGNNELQFYKAENAEVSNGTLKIISKKERVRGKQYTSARIRTKGLADFTYGRFEARIKLPSGQGLLPAFWMLSSNEPYGGWPQSGEIDIMEILGQNPETAYGTIHYGPLYPDNQHQGGAFTLTDGTTFADDFHVFALEWEPGVLRWYVDDILYSTKTDADVAPHNWPFDSGNQMHFLLNVAVGGNWPGDPDATTPFPNTMEVDWVRVYDGNSPSISGSRLVSYMATGEVYSIDNTSGSTNFNWSVPAGATIASGQGTNSITVNFGETSGQVTCNVTTDCIAKQYAINVEVEPDFIFDYSFENFDTPANITLSSTTGTLTEVSNPNPSGVNTSAISAEYVRNSGEQYDLVVYSTSAIADASLYTNRQKKFFMDVQTNAAIGTEVIIQLESPDATPSNYPSGRHSRYIGTITQNGDWERIVFSYLDSPDGATADTDVSTIIVLFASNSLTGDTYYWDNFDSYKADDGSSSGNTAPVASFNYSTTDLAVDFDGSASSDSDGSISSYAWNFGDGNSANGQTAAHTFASAGDYTVVLTVTDNEGATDTESQVITVTEGATNAAPVASFTYNTSDLVVNFDGSSSSDSDGSISSYAWDFGDGNNTTGQTSSHTYAASGDYTVILTVTDNEGATDTESQVVTVTEGATSDPVSIHVQSVITGTEDAGRGAKRGAVTITIHNDLEGVESGATVTGTFSGTFSETVSGVTGVNGTVYLTTSATAKGGVTVDFCVDNVSHSSLVYDDLNNDITCTTNKSASTITSTNDSQMAKKLIYPNPVKSHLNLHANIDYIEIINTSGQVIISKDQPLSILDLSDLKEGIYLVRLRENNSYYSELLLKK